LACALNRFCRTFRTLSPAGREARRKASVLGIEGFGWDVGHAVRFLLSAQVRYITGQTVEGGEPSRPGPRRRRVTGRPIGHGQLPNNPTFLSGARSPLDQLR
jgi:hypothetical protein